MAITPVSRERHGGLRWQRPGNYAFAARRVLIPLVAGELGHAAAAFPIPLTEQSSGLLPVALLGIQSDVNVFVGEDGRWRGRYVPAELRGYPFSLQTAEDGRQILCVEEDSSCLTESPEGTPFFGEDAKPCEPVVQVLRFLGEVERSRRATVQACKALQDHGCIEPWPIAVRSGGGEDRMEGLFRVNERALNALPDEALLAVRRAGGLPIAYAQLLSMQQLAVLGELTAARAQRNQQVQFGQELDLSWLNSDILKLG